MHLSWNPSHWLASFMLALSFPAKAAPDLQKPAVVLVHGIYDRGVKMHWLARRLEAQGYETFCPSLVPADGSVPLETSAAQLEQAVETRFGKKRQLHVIGFSMGGLITRYWLAQFPSASRVESFATISSPHRGTWAAYFKGSPGVVEMRPRSEFLQNLERLDGRFSRARPYSIYTPLDLIILPATSSRWPIAKTEIHWSLIHPLMVFSPSVARKLLKNMQQAEDVYLLPEGRAGKPSFPKKRA